MSYRIKKREHHGPHRTMQDTTTASTCFVQNGSLFHLAIPCWYLVAEPPVEAHCHSRMHHDHVGWPSPNHPDHICQSWDLAHSCCSFDHHKHECDRCDRYIDMGRLSPIRLRREGYSSIVVAMDEPPSGLRVTGSIDDDKDWIVRIDVDARVGEAIKEKVEVPYTVLAEGVVSGRTTRDVVARGKIVVLPGPYE